MLLEVTRITISPGQTVVLENISWEEFESILEDLGENRGSRIAYDNSRLEINTLSLEHEVNKEYISDFVKVLLEELDIEFCLLGSTTFKNQAMFKGIKPDSCVSIGISLSHSAYAQIVVEDDWESFALRATRGLTAF